ncbi:uncharacterized protein LOC113324255 [Papaver somniferum]|uniref:uncharacterized protein LOC113324255 n=1 Tax=Papaver somniferum TaxID=3469 RepID=UPI000E6FA055|nr:uncharacterized protein LOC113324255 [Papaver somniferum]
MEHDLAEEGDQLAKEYFHEGDMAVAVLMKNLSWNCQGFLGKDIRDHIGHLNTLHAPDIIFLSEMKINDNRIVRLTNFLCMPNSVYVPFVGAAGGLILLWKDGFSVDIVGSTSKMIHAIVSDDPSKGEWFLSCTYGTPYKSEQKEQWSYIKDLSKCVIIPWVVLGDLNITIFSEDRNHTTSSSTSPEVLELIKDSDLYDLGFSGRPYTWTSNKHGTGKYKSRLDRAFINSLWSIDYPNVIMSHLLQRGSDHTLILLELHKESLVKGRNWKFFEHWLKNETCHDEIKKAWSACYSGSNAFVFSYKLSHTRFILSKWNKNTFGNIQRRISDLQQNISQLQATDKDGNNTTAVIDLEKDIRDLTDILVRMVFHLGFIRHNGIFKDDVCKTIKSFFHSGFLLKQLNKTRVSLIPKTQSPHMPEDFRPIALCNTLYKIISKVTALRMKKHISRISSPMQAAYVPGRLISENVCLVQEIFQAMKKKEGKGGNLALKMDMSKAFDRLEWSFLIDILKKFGFSSKFFQLISQCISTTEIEVLINGSPSKSFHPTRGIRQGDPLSPYLFILAMESFSRVIKEFSICSGQLINFSKSAVYSIGNMKPSDCQDISFLLQKAVGKAPEEDVAICETETVFGVDAETAVRDVGEDMEAYTGIDVEADVGKEAEDVAVEAISEWDAEVATAEVASRWNAGVAAEVASGWNIFCQRECWVKCLKGI